MAGTGQDDPPHVGQGTFQRVDRPARPQVPPAVDEQGRDLELTALADQLVLVPGPLELAPDLAVAVLVDAEPRGRHLFGVLVAAAVVEFRRPLEDGDLAVVALGSQFVDAGLVRSQPGGAGPVERLAPGPAEPGPAGVDPGAGP